MDVDGLTAAGPARINRLWATLAIVFPLAILVAGFVWFMRTYVVPPDVIADAHAMQPPADVAGPVAPVPRVQETTGTSRPVAVIPPAPQETPPHVAAVPATAFLFPPSSASEPRPAAGMASPFPPPVIPATSPFTSAPTGFEPPSTRSVSLPDPMTPQRLSTLAAEPLPGAEPPIAGPVPMPPRRPRVSTAVVRGPVPLPRPRPAY